MAWNDAPTLQDQILDFSRQSQIRPLSPFLVSVLDEAIREGYFPDTHQLTKINATVIRVTADYALKTGLRMVVLGMSGGVDSALTAAIFKAAGWHVTGVTMPIHQDAVETQRGIEACSALEIEHRHIDLSELYDQTIAAQVALDHGLATQDEQLAVRIRRGNVRARLRMLTLYNLAAYLGGIVASTDNFSELGAGFWTLHGDVGDFSPIQALLKSWEVPFLAQINGVPDDTVRAKPTDGLGIDAGDEAQLGCSYLEWDLMTYALHKGLKVAPEDYGILQSVLQRMGATWFKRRNPLRVAHPDMDRYKILDAIDRSRFAPEGFE